MVYLPEDREILKQMSDLFDAAEDLIYNYKGHDNDY